MGGFIDSLGNVLVNTVDTAGDFVESIGTNATTQAAANAANVQAQVIENDLKLQTFEAEQIRKAKQFDLIKSIVIILMVLAFILVVAKVAKPYLLKIIK